MADDTINLQARDLPKNTFIEGRILFPREFIASSQNLIDQAAYSSIINEESRLEEKTREKAVRRKKIGLVFGQLALILSIIQGLIIALFLVRYRRPKDIYEEERYLKIPDDNSPALVSYITSAGIGSNTIIATILDLFRRDYIKIHEDEAITKKGKKLQQFTISKLRDGDQKLLNHERYFMDWLINIMGNGSSVTTGDIKNYSKKNTLKFSRHYNRWSQIIKEDADRIGYFDKSTRKEAILLTISFPIGFILSIISLANENILGLALMLTSFLMLFQGISLLFRKSDYGYYQYKSWMEFRKNMKKLKKKRVDYDINKYPRDFSLIYGLALGLDQDILDSFNIDMGHGGDIYSYSQGWIYWYFLLNSDRGNAFNKSIENSFTGMTSPIGGGGGFTAGGGGGAGGGGAGGF